MGRCPEARVAGPRLGGRLGGPASLGRGGSGHGGAEEAAGVIQQDGLPEVDRGRQAAPQTTMAWGVQTPGEEA